MRRYRGSDPSDSGCSVLGILLTPLCCLWLVGCATFAVEYTGRVTHVTDGNRLTFQHDGEPEALELFGVDCPELEQPFGKEAKEATERLALDKSVAVKAWGKNPYTGRMIGVVILPDGTNLNHELVKAGLAWWDRDYPKEEELAELEAQARAAKRGLWSDPNPVPPWEVRPRWERRRLPP